MNTQKHLYQLTHWESNGKYRVNDIKNLAEKSAKWYTPMRILNIQVEDYVNLLLSFNAKGLKYYDKTDYLSFYFTTEKDAKSFCSYINKIAKSKNFYCY